MASLEDDDIDDFLYGDKDTESKSTPPSLGDEVSNLSEDVSTPQDLDAASEQASVDSAGPENGSSTTEEGEMEASDDDESSDSDIDIILDDDNATPPASAQKPNLVSFKIGGKQATHARRGSQQSAESGPSATTEATPESVTVTPSAPAPSGGVDVNAVASYEGTSLLDLDIDSFEDKPWRKPGADITDYFNYGFTEHTWKVYIARQKAIREEYSEKKIEQEEQQKAQAAASPPNRPGPYERGFPPQRPPPSDGDQYRDYPPQGYRPEMPTGMPQGSYPPFRGPPDPRMHQGPPGPHMGRMYGPPRPGPWGNRPPMMRGPMMRPPPGYYGEDGFRPPMGRPPMRPPPPSQKPPEGQKSPLIDYDYELPRKRPPPPQSEGEDPRAAKRRA
ncbi:Fip1 motif-domain-containing protein [Paraphysoderma sedebokerense]|nr:Fip1 motif-domain-containing protein [Paraphysoderma sedebokerense]